MSKKIFYAEHFYDKGSDNTEALEKNVKDYPFSSLANFLLLYHYKKTGNPEFENHAKKTALLFNNSSWLQFQLSEYPETNTEFEETNSNNVDHKVHEAAIHQTSENIELENDVQQASIDENIAEFQNVNSISETISKLREEKQDDTEEKTDAEEQEIPVSSGEEVSQQTSEFITIDNEVAANKTESLAFEPLHTVDYFASQGIKLTEDPVSNDKLGNQMKSFTAWLKSMKKLHPSKLEEQPVVNEMQVQAFAEESNMNTEVLTEAMAEVLIKQGKKDKAIEMFSKLSLINPAKSAYFASRIESIKSN